MIDPAAAPLATGRACASEQEDPAAAPKAPANNLEQFCLLMCRGLEVKKVSTHTSGKTPYSRIIWMHNDRTRFCIGKSKNADDAIDIPLTAIEEIVRDGAVPQRFTLITGARLLSLDVDTANSRNILVRMFGGVVEHYCAEERRRAEEQAAFIASASLSSAGGADCAICLGPVDSPLQL